MYSVREVEKILFDWLIPSIKWKSDNIGLQVGNYDLKVTKILIALNPKLDVVNEAIDKKCNLIITHHPLFFFPVKNIISGEDNSDTITALIKNNISLISCHTNFDLAKDGVSYLLGKELGLNDIKPLVPLSRLRNEVENSENNSNNFGLGAYGDLSESLTMQECLKLISKTLKTSSLRISAKSECKKIKRIAMVGGSGAKYYKDAKRVNADLYLTSECSHHTFLDAEKTMFIVDATHQATEQFAVKGFQCYLERMLKQTSIFVSQNDKDPIEFFKI